MLINEHHTPNKLLISMTTYLEVSCSPFYYLLIGIHVSVRYHQELSPPESCYTMKYGVQRPRSFEDVGYTTSVLYFVLITNLHNKGGEFLRILVDECNLLLLPVPLLATRSGFFKLQ